ncbi:unnamed protein product, partial [Ectocarpus sp. 8 AP-2014]
GESHTNGRHRQREGRKLPGQQGERRRSTCTAGGTQKLSQLCPQQQLRYKLPSSFWYCRTLTYTSTCRPWTANTTPRPPKAARCPPSTLPFPGRSVPVRTGMGGK